MPAYSSLVSEDPLATIMQFSDVLYQKIEMPDWLMPFVMVPEFLRLRGVRLSNVDSVQFKDLNGPSRWEHSIGVAFLALEYARIRHLSDNETARLCIAALLHDVATPPFAHTMESVLEGFDHELAAIDILTSVDSDNASSGQPVFASQLPQFAKTCDRVSKEYGLKIEPDEVARLIIGDGELGYLINGSLDLDNADNVTRACLHMGFDIDKSVPQRIVRWLASLKKPPSSLRLEALSNDAVQSWVDYRQKLYRAFYNSSDWELGRQAFLQHIIRRALQSGFSRLNLVWNTDEKLLFMFESLHRQQESATVQSTVSLSELIQRYRLIEQTRKIAEINSDSEIEIKALQSPRAIEWMSQELSSEHLELFILVSVRRYDFEPEIDGLFPPSKGCLKVFKLGDSLKYSQLPKWLQQRIPEYLKGEKLVQTFATEVRKTIPRWAKKKPWLTTTVERQRGILSNLEAVGNWGFRLSRNESIHSYPSTFVHAIPATLINALGMKGELVLDPFGGTGQTATEAVRHGGAAISADSNAIATLVAETKLTYLNSENRQYIELVRDEMVSGLPIGILPTFDNIKCWHHEKTIIELCKIRAFIESHEDPILRRYFKTCFSAILPYSTGRRGKDHNYFADNTPLSKDETSPPYQPAIELFLEKVRKNLSILERFYGFLSKDDRDLESELKQARVLQLNAMTSQPHDYGIEPNSVGLIITSPPYLCMSDYTLGHRLSYYWLFEDKLEIDFKNEIGARRRRTNHTKVLEEYLASMKLFAVNTSKILRPGGLLATVLAAPVAKKFRSEPILERIDQIWSESGFEKLWSKQRPINWHRNHGYQRLREERIAVHVFDS